jgi:hypothetical protein
MDVSDEIGSLFPAAADVVNNEFVCFIVECVICSCVVALDVTTVEDEFANSSVVVGPIVFIIVPSVDISKDEDKDEYFVEVI